MYRNGRVRITPDTTPGVASGEFDAQNLLKNLENRSCGNGVKALKTAAVYGTDFGGVSADATTIDDETCFKTSKSEL